MTRTRTAPDVSRLLALLDEHGVRHVVTGSVAARLHGVEVEPGDLDVAPDLDRDNLECLARLLLDLGATPESLGHWELDSAGERRWVEDTRDPEQLGAWHPDSRSVDSLDHLFHTPHGSLDIVPSLTGSFAALLPRAVHRDVDGTVVCVAHVDDLLSTLTVVRRARDAQRVASLRALQRDQG